MKKCPENCKDCHENCENRSTVLSKFQTWGILLFIAAAGCLWAFLKQPQQNSEKSYKVFSYPIMGTVCNVTFFENDRIAEKSAKAVYNELYKIESMCNIFNPLSEITKLNTSAADRPFVCSPELYELLLKCKKAHELTRGTFDITAKPLMDLWGFYTAKKQIPTQSEIAKTLEVVGLNKVKFDNKHRSVAFSVKGMSFDLGGVAKGAALDNAAAAAKAAGAKNFLLNLGGNIACFGKNKNGKNFFLVGIRDPQNRNAVIKQLQISEAFCATSGNYERFNIINGKRYSHIMNPLTGYPVQNMYSATVVTAKGIDSDILSTACFILGRNFAAKLAEKNIIKEAFIIYPENNRINSNHITNEVKK